MQTPSAIRNASLPKSLRGFDEGATRRLLDEIASVVESLTAERENLRRQVETLQAASNLPAAATSEDEESPEALGSVILAAKRAGEDLVDAAHEEANQILATAAAEAERVVDEARSNAEDSRRALAEQREWLEHERADHEKNVAEWLTEVEAQREATVLQARAEAESVLSKLDQRLSELRQEEDELSRLIVAKQTQFIAMLHAALEELEPLLDGGDDDAGGEPGGDDLQRELQKQVG